MPVPPFLAHLTMPLRLGVLGGGNFRFCRRLRCGHGGFRRWFGMQDHRWLIGNWWRGLPWQDFATAAANQAFIGGDQRHIGIDPDPADFGEYLDVEVDVVRRAFFVVAPGRNLADDLA